MTAYERTREFTLGAALATAIIFCVMLIVVFGAFGTVFEENNELKKQLECPEALLVMACRDFEIEISNEAVPDPSFVTVTLRHKGPDLVISTRGYTQDLPQLREWVLSEANKWLTELG